MNVHGALQHRVRSSGVHEIENAMDDLVAPDAENGRSRMRLSLALTTIFMNPWVSPFSTARLTLTIGRFATSAGSLLSRTCRSVVPARPKGGSM